MVCGLALWLLGVALMSKPVDVLSPLYPNHIRPVANASHIGYEIFGFAPHWTLDKLDNVDFNVLTTLAYFGVPVLADGNLDTSSRGYEVFKSNNATELFNKAHNHGTRIQLTLTQMEAGMTEKFLSNKDAQSRTIDQAVNEVSARGIDGINVDFEYFGSNGEKYRQDFTNFVANLTLALHQRVPGSKVSVALYASAAISPRIYDISSLSKTSDQIFMMAYDFAGTKADIVAPTSPLYGAQDGSYWYDISTAVDDFLTQMPCNKLVLGLPWYGYNYPVYSPGNNALTQKGYYVSSRVRTKRGYKIVRRFVSPPPSLATTYAQLQQIGFPGEGFTTGWDDKGQVGWVAYKQNGVWRMAYQEDTRSLAIKYDFAKQKNLGGVGIWALGFEGDANDFWALLREKFSAPVSADASVIR
ncbi:MAG: hypothetical protein A2782_01865 [Candidatus Blackburnbacteria bacterium RIFCSPHIGHO2_01_FULL_43_15b]|uniref:GH18 domain-containing protein n=1 Tax=Candidatus Blackburnbacteria bacterium RIFCSPHIGHO2_01_FULL_43_15b TaxID=1797513 RepID=A0A1G1V1I3_9BACT|nr:MAG: hypothetical protein A2782_01865 [Candidatus Blackburnbacteria bacterium RIFCSPHIGHO2_01_FULL_43_15b]